MQLQLSKLKTGQQSNVHLVELEDEDHTKDNEEELMPTSHHSLKT
jgi:hypothetical protein